MTTALLVTCAATLLESTPFVLAAALIAQTPLRQCGWMVSYLGCGCGAGPSARSLPAAAALCAVFGPLAAVARFAAAVLVARLQPHRCGSSHGGDALAQLLQLLPFAAGGAFVSLFAAALFGTHAAGPLAFGIGAIGAFVLSPCAIGAAGFAASLRVTMPAAAAGFLCVAGIVDFRAWTGARESGATHDVLAYLILAAACASVAAHGGAGLVHPRIALVLWPCAAAALWLAYVHRAERSALSRIAPAIMFAGSVLFVPPPQYFATETTLAGAFAGEHVDFTGSVTRSKDGVSLVRYAITCCRADAAPIAIRVANPRASLHGWIHARGSLVESRDGLELQARNLQQVTPPADPFVYR